MNIVKIRKRTISPKSISPSGKQADNNSRLNSVRLACEQLVADGEEVTYAAVSKITDIPKRSLERPYYSKIIARYRSNVSIINDGVSRNDEAKKWQQEAEYWRKISDKQKTAIKELLTLLAEKGISTKKHTRES